ncbi:MAG: nicotinate-nucleotide diphosphorylase (carboxylating) [Chloroflexi bacterium]|nr:nicotinate-nucleotide diphosphorylase (carboxylating) [Chloroflexota bacterium]|tara:strand:+ start:4838 stop:5737 length:900 start_codon:yes stop_codon:yes gene_type:complete
MGLPFFNHKYESEIINLSSSYIDDLITMAFNEDSAFDDITTNTLLNPNILSSCNIIAKSQGVISGVNVVKRVFELYDNTLVFENYKSDGEEVFNNEKIANVSGKMASILSSERVALNFLQRMSGISTETNKLVKYISSTSTKLIDTRKTTPGYRMLDKYAVKMGGATNHRINLSEAVLIKDNHIEALLNDGYNLTKIINMVRDSVSSEIKIEIEVESIKDAIESIEAGADIIMLDNMSIKDMEEIAKFNTGRSKLEASGGITKVNILDVAKTGVDLISVGAITHSFSSLDISLDYVQVS